MLKLYKLLYFAVIFCILSRNWHHNMACKNWEDLGECRYKSIEKHYVCYLAQWAFYCCRSFYCRCQGTSSLINCSAEIVLFLDSISGLCLIVTAVYQIVNSLVSDKHIIHEMNGVQLFHLLPLCDRNRSYIQITNLPFFTVFELKHHETLVFYDYMSKVEIS